MRRLVPLQIRGSSHRSTPSRRPGPTNELLAATAAAFVRSRKQAHGQTVHVVAQWEVAAALRTLGASPPAVAIGTCAAVLEAL